MKRLLAIVFLLSAVGCMNNRWGLLYDGQYSSSDRTHAYAEKFGLTYEEAFEQLHSHEQQMWSQVNELQQEEQPRQQPPANATEAKQVDPVL